MTESDIIRFVENNLSDTRVLVAGQENGAPEVSWGDIFFYYDPDGTTDETKTLPYATIVVHDYPGFDEASELNRPGVFRVNLRVTRETFEQLVDDDPDDRDFAVLDEVMPHPIYGSQSWLSVLNPLTTGDLVENLLTEAHDLAATRYEKREHRL